MTLLELMKLLRKHLKLVIVLPVLCALAAAVVSWGFLADQYTATVSAYVLQKSDQATSSTSYSDLNASQMVANDVAELAKTQDVKDKTAESLRMSSLKDAKVSVTSSTTTRVIQLSVTTEDADSAAIIANKYIETISDIAQSKMGLQGVSTIDSAKTPTSPSGPNRPLYVAVALLAGLFLAIAIIVVADMVNTRVRTPEEAEELLGLPIIGRIPKIKA